VFITINLAESLPPATPVFWVPDTAPKQPEQYGGQKDPEQQ